MTAVACGTRGSAFEGNAGAIGRDARAGVYPAVAGADYLSSSRLGGPVLVNCRPGERALIRPTIINGEHVAQVDCVGEALSTGPAFYPGAAAPDMVAYDSYGRPMVVRSDARVVPAVATYSAPAPRVVTERRVVRVERNRRSWKKTALVIGGSTATGAGIGGVIGGKKGALIGAAIGGGASSIYEAAKR